LLSAKKISVLDAELPEFIGQILKNQNRVIPDQSLYYESEDALTWVETKKFILD